MDYPFSTWKYEDQTRTKHQVLEEYLDKWVKVLGSSHQRLNYFDCFAGCGAYADENGDLFYGSPIRAAQVAESNHKQLRVIVIDSEQKNIDNLDKVFDHAGIRNANIVPIVEDHDKVINQVLDDSKNLAPSFFLIDPFGFKL